MCINKTQNYRCGHSITTQYHCEDARARGAGRVNAGAGNSNPQAVCAVPGGTTRYVGDMVCPWCANGWGMPPWLVVGPQTAEQYLSGQREAQQRPQTELQKRRDDDGSGDGAGAGGIAGSTGGGQTVGGN